MLPQIGIFNGSTESYVYNTSSGNNTGDSPYLSSGIATYGGWNNYAVDFNQAADTISIYTNQTLLKTLNLAVFAGGADANFSNAAVSVGGAGATTSVGILWTDNFQVGAAAVPEPSTAMLAGLSILGLAAVTWRRRASHAAA